jgi:hypothetical protein
MANRDQVINVSMTLNTKGFSDGLVFSDKQAKALGKSIANALTLDVKSATNGLKAINVENDKLMKSFNKMKGIIKDTFSLNVNTTNRNIQSIAKELGALTTQASKTSTAMNSIKFVIGDTNRNIKSVITQLEKLETVAARVGKVSTTVGGGRQTTTATTTQGAKSTQAVPPPTFSRATSEYTGPFITPEQKAANTKEYADMLDKRAKLQVDSNKQMAALRQQDTESIKKHLDSIPTLVEAVGKKSQSAFSQYFSASFFGNVLANSFAQGLSALKDLGEETVLYAARTQELEVVLTSLARVHSITTQEITNQEEAIKRLNITTQDARETLAKFINVGFDIKAAGPLARVAQDLAVIGNKNTSEELNQLVVAIQTLQSRNLRNAGVFLTVDEVLDKLSATTGRARDSFSTLEKQQAVLNAVMEYGGRVAGTYQAAMGTTAKQLRSLDRQFKEAQNAIGEDFVGSLGLAVQASSQLLIWIAKYPDVFTDAAISVGLFTASLLALNTEILQGAYASVANALSALGHTGKDLAVRRELEAAITQEKEAQLVAERANIESTQVILTDLLAQLETEQGINATLAEQIGLRGTSQALIKEELLSKQAANAASLGRVTAAQSAVGVEAAGASLAVTVGQIAGLLAIVAILATVGKLVYDLITGPYTVGSLDINAISNEAEKTKELQALQTNIINDQVDLKKSDLEISEKITDSRIAEYRISKQQTAELEKQNQLSVIGSQLEANKVREQANRAAASLNIFQASSNLADARRTATLEAALAAGKEPTNYTGGQLLSEGYRNVYGVGKGLVTGDVQAGLKESETANFQASAKEEQKAIAQLNDTLAQAQKVADAYGVSLDSIIDDSFSTGIDKTTQAYKDQKDAINETVEAMRKQQLEQIKIQSGTPAEKINTLITDYSKSGLKLVEDLRKDTINEITHAANSGNYTPEGLQAYGESLLEKQKRGIELFHQNFGTDKSHLSSFAGDIGAAVTEIENQNGPLSYEQKIAAINEQVKIAREINPAYVKDLLEVGQGFTANTKLVESYLGAHLKLNDELRNTTAELQGFISLSPEDRKLGFQIESNKKLLSTLQNISTLEFELNKAPTNLGRFEKNYAGALAYEKSLQRQQKLQEAIIEAKQAELAVQDDINLLRVRSTIPLVNTELLAQKAILESIQKRREEEQQLTVDIAQEIDKRTRYALDSASETNRLSAQVFLDAQKTERQTQEDAIKNVLGLALQSGNDKVFTDNPLIKEAVKQSENLANLEKQGGIQGQKLTVINDTAVETNKKLETINSTLVTKLQEIIDKPAGGGFSTDTTSGGYGTSSVGGSVRQRFNVAYNRFASAGVNPNEAKFYAAISAAEGGGDVMYGGRQYNPRDPRHPGMYLPGKMGPAGMSYASGPLQITRENWLKYGGGDFSNMANHVRIAEILSGRGAVQAARSGDFARAFRLGGGNAWAAIPGSHLPGRQQSMSLIESLLGTNLASPTQSVVSKIQATPAVVRGKGSWQAVAERYGLSAEEVSQILANAPKTSKGLAEIGETAFATAALLKEFGGNAFATGVEATAIGNVSKDIKGRTEAVNLSAAMRNVMTFNQASLSALDSAEAWEKYKTEVNTENNFGASNRATSDAIERRRLTSLRTRGSTFYNQAYGEASSKRIADQVNLEKELIGLQEESDYRATNRFDYRQNQAKLFYKEQLVQAHALDDTNSQLFERENAYLDANSQLRKNILAQELQERRAAKQTLTEEIDALNRYNTEYLNSAENRARIEREGQRDRLKEHQDTVNQILRLETDLSHVQDGLQDRLHLKQAQINDSRAKEYEDMLQRQLQAENDFKRKSDPFNAEEFRTGALEKINSSMKDSTTLMKDLFSDSFDGISSGFGGLVDKMSARLGIFGQAIGNFLKSTFNNLLGSLSKSLLGGIFGQNTQIQDVLNGGSLSSDSKPTPSAADILGIGKNGSGSLADASTYAAQQVTQFGYAVAQASGVVLQVAGQTGASALTVGGIVNTGLAKFTGKGTFGGGGGPSTAGVGNIFGGIPLINNAVATGTNNISNAAGRLPSGGGGEYSGLLSSLGGLGSAGNIGGHYPDAYHSSGGILSKLSGALNLKGVATSLFQAGPAIGAGFGGLLGGSSAVGGALGQVGGGILGLLGGAAGLSLLAGTGGGILGAAGTAGSIGILGLSGAATLGIGAAVAGAFLLASYLFGRAKRRKEEKAKVVQISGDAMNQLQDLLKGVKSDKIDGDEALSRSQEIRDEYVRQIATLKTSPGKRDAQVQLQAMDAVIAQITLAAHNQKVRRELDAKIVPTYAYGGVANSDVIRVSQGESLFVPSSAGMFSGSNIASGNIPNFGGGGTYAGARIRGNFDGKDNILMRVPKGTVIANPRQASKIRPSRFASGGVSSSNGTSTAQGTIVVQPPPVTAIIVFSSEEAEALGRQIPNSVIVGKVRKHVKDTGSTGLAGDVLSTFIRP